MRTDFGVPDMGPHDMGGDACLAEEVCNGEDDDCDGVSDEGFDLDVDMLNCGACGNACDADPVRGSTTCEAGECLLTCDEGFADCDGDDGETIATGCETSLMTGSNCGSCGNACPVDTPICDVDVCVADCPDGTSLCPGGTCADLQSSVSNCGTCGMECADAPNASPLCTEGACRLRCDAGFFNCDTMTANGCESRHRENANCGACGVACAADNAMTSCLSGECAITLCTSGFEDCDGDAMNGCEANVASDPNTCGGCGTACPADPANAASTCTMGSCGVTCDPGYADCDTNPANGCETFLGSVDTCGGCAIRCDGATPVCSGSTATGFSCTAGCAAGETQCGSSCVDLMTDAGNCNGCGNVCADPPRASPTCAGGACGFNCDAGYRDCNMDASDGCETSTTTTMNCNGCGNVCAPAPDATIGCTMSGCAITACAGTKRNCDGMYANGCETNIATSPDHCGGCGVACVPGMRVTGVACEASSCVITSCEVGYADCDGDFATGCEQRLGSKFHCSACDDRCRGGGMNTCCDGVCGSC